MPVLPHYTAFVGRHWETGSICNILAYQGVTAPHTGEPLSEALLMGICGGAAVGYFLFHYEGYDPHLALLTRNTFDPLETLFDRLAIPRDVLQTRDPHTGEKNLIDVLESGRPALVWADVFCLPYNALPYDEKNWAMWPVVVFGVEDGQVHIADRSGQPLHVTLEQFTAARARVKKDKFRVVTLDPPDLDRLPAAVQKGIWQCLSLYTEAPPKGTKDNFGLAALLRWAAMLTNQRNKQGWARFFPPGSALYSALAGTPEQPGAFVWICTWGASGGDNGGAERVLYARFLDEAAAILGRPALYEAADRFRASSAAWCDLANQLLPNDVPFLKETRDLLLRRHALFVEAGDTRLDDIRAIDARLRAIRDTVADVFPLNDADLATFRESLADHVLRLHEAERAAVHALQAAME